ncbi:MAG: hypothetical protein M3T96_08905 [Acidobacteriota bacterium]|nr:hypothetical protein [Acidobacteriota bacterium]
MSETQTLEIISAINSLPSEKVDEVRDFVLFLRERYGEKKEVKAVDYSDEWTDEDLRDFAADTFNRYEKFENEAGK